MDKQPLQPIRFMPDVALMLSALFIFVAERILVDQAVRTGALVLSLFMLAYGIGARARVFSRSTQGHRAHAMISCLSQLVFGVAFGVYFFLHVDREYTEGEAHIALIVALVLGVSSLIVTAMISFAASPVRFATHFDARRIYTASAFGMSLSLALPALIFANVAAVNVDWRYDFSYGGPAKPSPATRSVIEAAEAEIEIYLFFPTGNAALAEVKDYFEALRPYGVRLEIVDQALKPRLAEELKVSRNGTIAMRAGERSESWFLSDKRKSARRKLKKLDEEVRTRLSKITRDEKVVYFTRGHGERDSRKAKKGERLSGSGLQKLLKTLNASAKDFGVAQGLGQRVPVDADLVVIFGPTKPFLDEEVNVLIDYVNNDGALLMLLDPEYEANLDALATALQLKLSTNEVCNDKEYIKSSRTKADHAFIFSTSFTSHKAVKTLSSVRGKAAVFFLRASAVGRLSTENLAENKKHRITALARTRSTAFEDSVPNRVFDAQKEKRAVSEIAVAIEGQANSQSGLRAVVVGDSDAFADGLLNNEANQVFSYETMLWLMRDDQTKMGKPQLEEDVPIRHTRDQDTIWFYGTVFAVPCLLYIWAFFILPNRRRRVEK